MTKKIVALLTLATMFSGPVSALADVNTSFTASNGSAPSNFQVVAKWETTGTDHAYLTDYWEDDDLNTAGIQVNPPLVKNGVKPVTYCAVVSYPGKISQVSKVYMDLKYVETANATGLQKKCGVIVSDELELTKKADWSVFCKSLNPNNSTFYKGNNIVKFVDSADRWTTLCTDGLEGSLYKGDAALYCGTRNLSYEAAAGVYDVKVHAVANGLDSNYLQNNYLYVPMAGFEIDFNKIDYSATGAVTWTDPTVIGTMGGQYNWASSLVKWNDMSGDINWAPTTTNNATVRNIGNVELDMNVAQDYMNTEKTNGMDNIRYRGRIGSNDGWWLQYAPQDLTNPTYTKLVRFIELSNKDEMDFGVAVTKFTQGVTYQGKMKLMGTQHDFCACPTKISLPGDPDPVQQNGYGYPI